jgi:hypothetical protein
MRESGDVSAGLNASLFFTMAGMMIETLFPDKIPVDLREDIRKAMHKACLGNARREGGWHGDDMWPSYSNVSAFLQRFRLAHSVALVPPMCVLELCRQLGR